MTVTLNFKWSGSSTEATGVHIRCGANSNTHLLFSIPNIRSDSSALQVSIKRLKNFQATRYFLKEPSVPLTVTCPRKFVAGKTYDLIVTSTDATLILASRHSPQIP